MTISVAVATYNEEENLARCLASVADWTDEIVVVDGGSRDRTVAIAKEFGAKVLITENPFIFHINKQKALDACRGGWILQLDADEVVSPELRKEILELMQRKPNENGFYIPRKNFFVGQWLRKGGQYPDYVVRLLRRGKGRFPCQSVHEQIEIDGKIGYLKNPLLHYSYRTISEYWRKADSYISLTALELMDRSESRGATSWVRYFVIKPIVTFFSLYIRHKGFLDGYYGFLFALFSALHHPVAFCKYRRSYYKLID